MTNDRKARAARAEQMRKERDRAERRQRNVISLAIVAVVVALIAVGGWGIKKAADDNAAATDVVVPGNLTEGGVLYPANAGVDNSKAPLLQFYGDFQCPACQQLNQVSGPYLAQQAAEGKIRLVFMPHSFLDEQGGSSNDYSKRSTNVAMCVATQDGPEAFWKFHDYLYANQPSEGSAGPENSELIESVKGLGLSVVESCVKTGKYTPWITKVKDEQVKAGITGTPTLFLDGKETKARTPTELEQAFAEAAKS